MKTSGRWYGLPPKHCDACGTAITDKFYDARTEHGPWACMCPSCFTLGPGVGRLGKGLGQEYSKVESGGNVTWPKTGG